MRRPFFALILLGAFTISANANESLETQPNRIRKGAREACTPKHCYFIRQGRIYWWEKGSDKAQRFTQAKNIAALLIFNNSIFALKADGNLFKWQHTGHQCWIHIAESIEKIQSDGKNLFAIGFEGTLLTFDNGPFVYEFQKRNNNVEYCFARQIFYFPGVTNVDTLTLRDGKTYIIYRDGKEESVFRSSSIVEQN